MTSIYRFERLEYFEQAVWGEELTFVSPYLWPDKNEGFLFRATCRPDGMVNMQTIAHDMFKSFFPEEHMVGIVIGNLMWTLRNTILAQCWSNCEGNSSLWENKDVRIEVHREDISKLAGVEVRDVEYTDSVTIEDGLRRLKIEPVTGGGGHIDIRSVICVKHDHFSHEHEVRLILEEPENVNRDQGGDLPLVRALLLLYGQGKISKKRFETAFSPIVTLKKISFAHIENFIKSVMLNNSASPEVEMKVQKLCQEHCLNYLGRCEPQTS